MGAIKYAGPIDQNRREINVFDGTSNRTASPTNGPVGLSKSQLELQRPLIYFFGGGGDTDDVFAQLEDGYNKIADKLGLPKVGGIKHFIMRDEVYHKFNNANYEKAFFTWDVDPLTVIEKIFAALRLNPLTPICLVGHSYGGDTAMDVAELLASSFGGIQVSLLVTLDPVSTQERITTDNIKSLLSDVVDCVKSKGDLNKLSKFKYTPFTRFKPANISLWANVWVNHDFDPIEQSNLVARLGGPWRHQQFADQNIPMPQGIVHFHAAQMFAEVKPYIDSFPYFMMDAPRRQRQIRQYLNSFK